MEILNGVFNFIFSIIFSPFKNIGPFWGMLVVSVVTGVLMLFVFKATSDQKGIKRAKNLVKGHFLAIRLYRDDFTIMVDTLKNIIVSNLGYMQKSLKPMLFLLIPVGMVLFQIGTRYEYRPFRVGETTIVSLRMEQNSSLATLSQVQLDLPDGLVLEIPPVRIPQRNEINWRVNIENAGMHELVFNYGGQTITKKLEAVDELIPVAAEISKDDVIVQLMNPGENVEDAAFASIIGVNYPKRDFSVLGWEVHWLIAFFLISVIAAFSFKGLLGVEV